jgi:hypothetical protein
MGSEVQGLSIWDLGFRNSDIARPPVRPRRRPRPRPRNRKKYNGVKDEDEYEDDLSKSEIQNPQSEVERP